MSENRYKQIINDPYYTLYYIIKDIITCMENNITFGEIFDVKPIDLNLLDFEKDYINYENYINIIRSTNFIIFKFKNSTNKFYKIDYMNELYGVICDYICELYIFYYFLKFVLIVLIVLFSFYNYFYDILNV